MNNCLSGASQSPDSPLTNTSIFPLSYLYNDKKMQGMCCTKSYSKS